MTVFVIVGHKCNTDGLFSLNDLTGSTGRLDILLRCVGSAFHLSNGLRKDPEVHLVLTGEPDPPKTVRMVGSELKYLNPDERSTAALVKNALMQNTGPSRDEINASPGIYVSRRSFEEVLEHLAQKHGNGAMFVHLREDGEPLRIANLQTEGVIIFVMGGQFDLGDDEENILEKYSPKGISLGPHKLHASHCITVVLNELDVAE